MKFLAITGYYKPAYVYGGPVRSQAALYEGLAKLGVDVTVITTNANGKSKLDVPLLTPINVDGVQVIYCPTQYMPGSPFYAPDQIRLAKQYIEQVDVVNLQTFWSYATPHLVKHCLSHAIPYFVSLRGQLMTYGLQNVSCFKKLKKHLFLRLFGYTYLNRAKALHATSIDEAIQLKRLPIHAPIFIVPNSIDLSDFDQLPERGTIRKEFNIPDDAFVLVMIGRIHAVKNPQIGISVLGAIQQLGRESHLVMVGPDEGGLQPSLELQAQQLGCFNKLHFTGLLQKTELLQVLVDADLLLMPSVSENFGMGAIEALAAGVPALVSEGVGVGIHIVEASAGRMVACDESSFAHHAIEMLSDPEELCKMGQRGRIFVHNQFEQLQVARNILNYLEKIKKSESI